MRNCGKFSENTANSEAAITPTADKIPTVQIRLYLRTALSEIDHSTVIVSRSRKPKTTNTTAPTRMLHAIAYLMMVKKAPIPFPATTGGPIPLTSNEFRRTTADRSNRMFLETVIHRLHQRNVEVRRFSDSRSPVTTQISGSEILPIPATTLSLNKNSVSSANGTADGLTLGAS